MKWVGRIFYVIIVLYLILFIETSGGAKGLAMTSYMTDNLYNNETVIEELEQMSAIHDIYIEKAPAHTLDIKTDTHDFKLSFYRFATLRNTTYAKKNNTDKLELILDGYLIHTSGLNTKGEDLKSYEFTFNYVTPGYSGQQFNTKLPVATLDNRSTVIAPYGYTLLSYHQHIIAPILTKEYGEKYNLENVDFSKIQSFEINGLRITENQRDIYYGQEGKPQIPGVNNQLIFDFEPINMSNDLLSIDSDIFGQRAPFSAFPTKDTVKTKADTLVLEDINLSKYTYSYIIIWGIYAVFILIIPFFLWVRKPLVAHIKNKKELKRRQAKIEASKTQKQTQYKTVQEAEIIEETRKKKDK